MISTKIHRTRLRTTAAGYTLLDLLVVIAGAFPALWLTSYLPRSWQIPLYLIGSFIFGIGFWCALNLALLPWLRRRRSRPNLDDNEKPDGT
jgi:hypothetical protein